jgi:hypothetical protein
MILGTMPMGIEPRSATPGLGQDEAVASSPDGDRHPTCGLRCGRDLRVPRELSNQKVKVVNGGGSGIRTHGTLARTTVFETAPFDRSGIPPRPISMA